jgi:hypothetical protein
MNQVQPIRKTYWTNMYRMVKNGFKKAISSELLMFLSMFAIFSSKISGSIRLRHLFFMIVSFL